jgi:predicted Holliday junction resolvase-like endonuclease
MWGILRGGSAIAMVLFSALKENNFHIIFIEMHTGKKNCSKEDTKLTGLCNF